MVFSTYSIPVYTSPNQTPSATVARNNPTYQYAASPVGTVVVGSITEVLLITSPSPIDALAIALPSSPTDGQELTIVANKPVAALTLTVSPGQSIVSAPTSLKLSQPQRLTYTQSNSTWTLV
jgi:hypothetical protein